MSVLAALLILGAAAEPPRGGSLTVSVGNDATRQPIAAARVSLEGAGLEATSDGDGRVLFAAVPAGSYRILVEAEGFVPIYKTDVVVAPARRTEVVVRMPVLRESVEVTAQAFAKPKEITNSAYSMDYEEIRRAPGALGDVNRLIQTMPGAAARDDQRNDIIARGGSPTENLTLVDGIEVPSLNHFAGQGASGGPINMLNTELIQDARFLAGGFPAPYGNRLSSVLDVGLREGSRERFEASLELGVSGAGLLLEGPLAKGSWVFSARKSFVELIADSFGIAAVPRFSNMQGKLVQDVGRGHRLSFLTVGGLDAIEYKVLPEDEDDPNQFNFDDHGWRIVNALSWQMPLGRRGVGALRLSHGRSSFAVDIRDTTFEDRLIATNRSREDETTLKYELTYDRPGLGQIAAGAQVRRYDVSLDIEQPYGLENVFSVDTARVNAVDIDRTFATHQPSAYVQLSRPLVGRLDATLGARWDRYDYAGRSTVTPRLGLAYHLRPNLEWTASFGRYSQLPPLVFMNADPINRGLRPIGADHWVTGFQLLPVPSVKLTLETYYKRYRDYPVSTEYPAISFANIGELYDPAGFLFPMVSRGTGRAFGIEVYLQKKLTRRLYGQLSYALSQVEHRALDGVWRRGGFDMPHVFSAIGGYKLGPLELSSKLTYTSGRPDTPLRPESVEQNRLIFDMDRLNADRAPAYHRLDVRADRRFSFRWANLIYFLECQNLYDRRNIRVFVWNPKLRERDFIPQLRRLVLGGVNVQF